jgi:hypothetical protein
MRILEPKLEVQVSLQWSRQRSGAKLLNKLEARVGIEPTHKGFADLSLTTWVPRLGMGYSLRNPAEVQVKVYRRQGYIWSGRRGSNPRHLPWQGSTLPLSYSRSYRCKYNGVVSLGQRAQTFDSAQSADCMLRAMRGPAMMFQRRRTTCGVTSSTSSLVSASVVLLAVAV